MLSILKELSKSSKFKILIFLILELNIIYAVAYIGNMIIEGHYFLMVDLSIASSLLYILILPLVGYILHRFFTKRVSWNIARVLLYDSLEFGLLAAEKLKNSPPLESKINKHRNELNNRTVMLEDLDNINDMIQFNYFIIFTFSILITMCNYTQVNILAYILIQASFFIVTSLVVYLLSFKAKRQIKYILDRLKLTSIENKG